MADLTDVYAFVEPGRRDKVTLIANVIPFESPAGGPNFYKFGDDVLYQLNVVNDGDPVAELEYQFRFTTTYANPNTFLYNTGQVTSLNDADLNVTPDVLGRPRSTTATGKQHDARQEPPGAAGQRRPAVHPDYEANLGSKGVRSLGGGIRSSPVRVTIRSSSTSAASSTSADCGRSTRPTSSRCRPTPGKDYVAGFNVHSFALQVPKSRLLSKGDP